MKTNTPEEKANNILKNIQDADELDALIVELQKKYKALFCRKCGDRVLDRGQEEAFCQNCAF